MVSYKILLSFILNLIFMSFCIGQSYQVSNAKIYDINNNQLLNPFAGGMNSPQFNEIDLNLDGVMDLLVFDRDGNGIIPYVFEGGQYLYAPQYKSIFPKFKKWVRLRDYNKDGIMDIFCFNLEAPLDGIEIYKGVISGGKLEFQKYKESFGQYEIIYYKFQNFYYNLQVVSTDLPDLVDVDGDGDLDIITFTGDESSVRFYQNMCIEEGISLENPTFILKDLCWGKFKESSFNESIFLSSDPTKCANGFAPDEKDFPTKNNIHSGSTITLYDDDNDGDFEAIIGDLTNQHLIWLNNGGSPSEAFMNQKDTIFPIYDESFELYIFNSGFIFDVDHDGNTDFVAAPNNEGGASNVNNVLYYRNTASNGQHDFQFVQNDLFGQDMIEYGSLTNPAICDYNQDGKKDIVLGTFGKFEAGTNPAGRLILFENVSTSSEQLEFRIVDEDYLGFSAYTGSYYSFAPNFGDIDNDGDDDLLVGTQSGNIMFLKNKAGSGNLYDFEPPVFKYSNIDVGDNSKPQIVDLNKDGLADIVIGERNQNPNPFNEDLIGNINYFQNVGTTGSPLFGEDEKILPNTPTLGFVVTREITESFNGSAAPFFIESDDDFILYTGSETGKVKVYNGIIDSIYGTFQKISDQLVEINEGKRTVLSAGDLNGDGLLDFVCGNQRGGLSIYNSNLGLDGLVGNAEIELIDFNVFPNPASDLIHIEIGQYQLNSISIYNQLGQKVYGLKEKFTQNTVHQIETLKWESGIYFIEFHTANNLKAFKKLVVQKD